MGRTCSLERKPLRFFSGGSMWDRQWFGLCVLLNSLLLARLRYSDTSHTHVEDQRPKRRTLWKKNINPVCWSVRKPPQADKAQDILLTIKAANISCNFHPLAAWLIWLSRAYSLCIRIDKTYETCSSEFKLSGKKNNTKKPSNFDLLSVVNNLRHLESSRVRPMEN